MNAETEAPILWPPDVKSQLIRKDSGAEKDWRQKKNLRWLDSTTNSMDMNLSKLQDIVKKREAWHAAIHGVSRVGETNLVTEQQQNDIGKAEHWE